MVRKIIGTLIIAGGCGYALYLAGWSMFIKPIVDCCKAFDSGSLTGLMIGTSVLKCIFAGPVGCIVAYVSIIIGGLLLSIDLDHRPFCNSSTVKGKRRRRRR